MNIPVVAYQASFVFALLSIGIQFLSIFILFLSVLSFGRNASRMSGYAEGVHSAKELFQSAAHVRNSALCLLIFLLFIADKSIYIEEVGLLVAISNICKRYASASALFSILIMLISVISIIRKLESTEIKELCGSMWLSFTLSTLLSFLLAYFLYLP